MKTQRILLLLFVLLISLSAFSQKRPLDPEDILKWNRITEQRISNDGQYIVYKAQPWKGDPELFITTKDLNRISLIQKGDAEFVLATSNLPYAVQTMWEGSPSHNDFYLIDIKTGKPRMIKKDIRVYPQVSPGGKYLYWFNAIDTTWNSYDLATNKEYQLCNPQTIQTANELNDVPNPPGSYRSAGWIKGDEALIVYDRYNIWSLDPKNEQIPNNLTKADKADGIS